VITSSFVKIAEDSYRCFREVVVRHEVGSSTTGLLQMKFINRLIGSLFTRRSCKDLSTFARNVSRSRKIVAREADARA